MAGWRIVRGMVGICGSGLLMVACVEARTPAQPRFVQSQTALAQPTQVADRRPSQGPLVAPAVTVAAPVPDEKPLILQILPWGTAVAQVGHRRDAEAMPEGPMALAVAPSGQIAVLDQVNSRVLLLAPTGQPLEKTQIIPLSRPTFQDIAFDPTGHLFALDRLHTPEVVGLSPGAQWSVPIAGEDLTEPAAVTGLFPAQDGVWLELTHSSLRWLAGAGGMVPQHVRRLPARPSADGQHLISIAVVAANQVAVSVLNANGDRLFTRKITMRQAILGVREWGIDPQGRAIIVVATALEQGDRSVDEHLTAVVLGADGSGDRRVELPIPQGPEEHFRPVRLAASGALYGLQARAQGVAVWRVQP